MGTPSGMGATPEGRGGAITSAGAASARTPVSFASTRAPPSIQSATSFAMDGSSASSSGGMKGSAVWAITW